MTTPDKKPSEWPAVRVGGAVLLALGIILAVILGVTGSQEEPPSGAVQAVLVLASIAAQSGAAWLFSQVNKPASQHLQRAIERLLRCWVRAVDTAALVEDAYDSPEGSEELGVASAYATVLAQDLEDAIEDWSAFAPRAVYDARMKLAEKAQKTEAREVGENV